MAGLTLKQLEEMEQQAKASAPKRGLTLEELNAMEGPATGMPDRSTGGATHPYRPDEPKRPDYGQLRAGTGGFWTDIGQDATNMLLPERFASDIIARNFNPEGTTRGQTEFGDYYIQRPGEAALYLNQPGLGAQDAMNLGGVAAMGGGLAAAGKGIVSTVPRAASFFEGVGAAHPMLTTGSGASAYSLAEQVIGDYYAPDEELSTWEIARDGIAGAMLPAALKPMVGPFRKALMKVEQWTTPNGQLTDSARTALDAAGIKWQHLDGTEIQKINDAVVQASKYTDKLRGRKGALAADDIDATLGMISQQPHIIRRELGNAQDLQRWGNTGENGNPIGAAQQLEASAQQQFPRQNPAEFQSNLAARAEADRVAAGDAFPVARETSDPAIVPSSVEQTLENGLRNRLGFKLDKNVLDSVLTSLPKREKGALNQIIGPDGKTPISSFEMPTDAPPKTFRDLFEWRKNTLPEIDPSGATRKAFDKEMQNILDQQLAGDMGSDAIRAWQKANAGYDEFTDVWRAGDVVERLVKKDKQGNAFLKDPQAAWNTLFNASKAGFIKKPDLQNAILKLQKTFGENSPEMRAFDTTLNRKMMQLDEGWTRETDRPIIQNLDSKGIRAQWQSMKNEWGEILDARYGSNPEIFDRMENFVAKAGWVDQKVGGAKELSTAGFTLTALKRIAEATFRFTRAGARQAGTLLVSGREAANEAELLGPLLRGYKKPAGTGAVAAQADEILWDEVYDEILRESGINPLSYLPEEVGGVEVKGRLPEWLTKKRDPYDWILDQKR